MTRCEHHAQGDIGEVEDTEDVTEDLEPEGQVQDSIAAHKSKKNIRKLAQFSDMVKAYALPVEVMKDSVPCTFREAELSSVYIVKEGYDGGD